MIYSFLSVGDRENKRLFSFSLRRREENKVFIPLESKPWLLRQAQPRLVGAISFLPCKGPPRGAALAGPNRRGKNIFFKIFFLTLLAKFSKKISQGLKPSQRGVLNALLTTKNEKKKCDSSMLKKVNRLREQKEYVSAEMFNAK